jgi:hypothetical protein
MRKLFGPIVIVVLLAALWMMFSPGNPGGISDAKYTEFQQLASPKILYSCTRKPTRDSLVEQYRECAQTGRAGCDEQAYESGEARTATVVEFAGGSGTSTYDDLLNRARQSCSTNVGNMGNGQFKILEAQKN